MNASELLSTGKPRRTPIAIRRQEQRLLREHVAGVMLEAGAVLDPDQQHWHRWTLDTRRVGRFNFTSHLSDEVRGSDLFSVYIRTDLGRTREDIHAAGEKILEVLYSGSRHFNGKHNVHSSTREGAEMELERIVGWMMGEGE